MRDMLGRSLFKFFRSPANSTIQQPSSSNEYQQLKECDRQHGGRNTSETLRTDPICIPNIRALKSSFSVATATSRAFWWDHLKRESSSSDYALGEGSCDHDYMLVDINQRLCKSVDIEKRVRGANMDKLDRVPMDFSSLTGPTIMTDPDEVGEILLCGESRAIYQDHSKIYGLAPCSIYRAERWFHQNADRSKAERMLLRTGEKDGSFLIRVNQRNCLVLTVCHHQEIYNIFINCKVEGHKTTLFIERSHQFSNLIDLIKYYTKHQGLFLPCKLTRGVALRWPGSTKYGVANRLFIEEDL